MTRMTAVDAVGAILRLTPLALGLGPGDGIGDGRFLGAGRGHGVFAGVVRGFVSVRATLAGGAAVEPFLAGFEQAPGTRSAFGIDRALGRP